MQNIKELPAQALFGIAEFPSLKEAQIFAQMEINNVFPIIQVSQNQAEFPNQGRIFAKWVK